jgi:hypothetical protein
MERKLANEIAGNDWFYSEGRRPVTEYSAYSWTLHIADILEVFLNHGLR